MRTSRAAALRLATAALVSVPKHPAIAWCGKPYPPYAYQLPWFEFQAGSTPVRIIGDNRPESARKLSPVLVLPSPGLSYEYMENLEAFTVSERRVAFAALSAAEKDLVFDFLASLGRAEFDWDTNNTIDEFDWFFLYPLMSGPDPSTSITPDDDGAIGDVDQDGDFDLVEFGKLQRVFTGQ